MSKYDVFSYNTNMYSLGINMAVQPYSFAITKENQVVESRIFEATYCQSESMITLIKSVLDDHTIQFDQLSSVGVTAGPGQYTGIRLGVAMANSIAMAVSIPIIKMTTFEALLYPYLHHNGIYLVCIPARKDEYNVQLFAIKDRQAKALTPFFSLSAKQLSIFLTQFTEPIYVISSVPIASCNPDYNIVAYINAVKMAQFAWQSIINQNEISKKAHQITPIYSHQPNGCV